MMNKKLSNQNNLKSDNLETLTRKKPAQSLNNHKTDKEPEINLELRLKEMEEINLQLESRVEQDAIQLNEVIERNSKFLSIIAHDLRNPFNSIIGILDILGDNLQDYTKDEIEKLIHIASNSAVNTYNLLENLLAWSVSQNKQKNFNPVKIDLHELIISELESFSPAATQKQITFDYYIAPDIFASADFQMVKAILRNLISNAIKFSNDGGFIFINAVEGKKSVEIGVMDNGVGIPPKTLRKLFNMEEFHSTMGTHNEYGTGMGLLFCKEFVELHGCKIWVESEVGKGSTFKFTLPHYL